MNQPKVAIVLGSDSDYPVIQDMLKRLSDFNMEYEVTVSSAHRSPGRTQQYAEKLESRGIKVCIACAGAAAHLAGVIAAHTIIPVIGVPIDSSALDGMDALLSTAQMPPGVPVSTMAIGKPGATNAGITAAQIIAVYDDVMAERVAEYKIEMAKKVEQKDNALQKLL